MAVTKIHAIKKTLSKAIAYIENPAKTEYGQLVSGYNCSPESATLQFELTERIAGDGAKGRRPKSPNLAYHLIQSFSPNDPITPEEAHELGKQLADRFLEGQYEYVISTHVDKGHIHNHIIINATSWLTGQKLRTQPGKTVAQIRAISDQICISHDLSVIRQPGRMTHSYAEWQARRNSTSWKAELRKRLNFVLARATDYDRFLSMCKELDVAVNDTGKHIKYKLRDLPQEKWSRGNKLADTDRFTYSGVQEQVEENAEVKKILWAGIMEEIGQSGGWDDLLRRLESNHEIKITQGKLGLIYHLPDGLKRKEAELGSKFSKDQLLRALSDREYIPGDEPSPSVREEWEAASHGPLTKEPETVPIRLQAENIERISLEGLLVRVPHNGQDVSVFIDNRHIDFDDQAKEYTAYLTSEYTYYAMQEAPNPDLPESEQLGNVELRGENIIRSLERENGAAGHWVDVPAEYIRSIRPDKLVLSFQRDYVTGVTIGAEDMRVSPDRCQIRIYDNWSYGRNFKGAEMRDILEHADRPVIDQMWRRYRAYKRSDQRQQIRTMEKVLQVMDREGVQGLKGLSIQRSSISAQVEARNTQIRLLRQRKSQYAMAHRYLEAVRTYKPIHDRVAQSKGWAKQKLEQSHQAELDIYNTAVHNLQAMNVQITVEPEKVAGMMDNLDDEIRRYRAEVEGLDKRMEEVTEAEAVVRKVLGEEQEDRRDQTSEQRKDRKGKDR